MTNINKQMDYGDVEFSENAETFCDMLREISDITGNAIGEARQHQELKRILQKNYKEYKDGLNKDKNISEKRKMRFLKLYIEDVEELFGVEIEDEEIKIKEIEENGKEQALKRIIEAKEKERQALIKKVEELSEELKDKTETLEDIKLLLYKAETKED